MAQHVGAERLLRAVVMSVYILTSTQILHIFCIGLSECTYIQVFFSVNIHTEHLWLNYITELCSVCVTHSRSTIL